ncbi:MAG: hypothetical protein AB1331_09835 [Bacillota bacterium]
MPTKQQMQAELARKFGYDDYETFRRDALETMGKAALRRVEKELDKYPDEENPPVH